MKSERFTLWEEGEYSYPLACGFVPNIVSYLHEDDEIHPAMIVVPGGGYMFVSPSEGEIIAEKFFGYGYNAFVVTYTVNILGTCPLKDQASKDLSRAIRFVRAHAEQFSIDPAKVAICGFSAGGHLSASLAVHHMDLPDANPAYQNISNRPDAAILSYPVITSGEKAHRGSFDALLGKDGTEEELHYASLETQVTDETSPCFLWHTATDSSLSRTASCSKQPSVSMGSRMLCKSSQMDITAFRLRMKSGQAMIMMAPIRWSRCRMSWQP